MAGHEWHVFPTFGDLHQLTLPEAGWLIDGLLPADGWTLLSAPPKVGKTTLALQLAYAVGCSGNFLNHARSGPPRRVCFLQADNTIGDWYKHTTDVRAVVGPSFDAAPIASILCPRNYLGNVGMVAKVKAALAELAPHLVVYDAFETSVGDSVDLNTRHGMSLALKQLTAVWEGPALVLHHLRKPGSEGSDVRWAAPAGHHSLSAAVSVVWDLVGNAERARLDARGRGMAPTTLHLVRDGGVWVVEAKKKPPSDLYSLPA